MINQKDDMYRATVGGIGDFWDDDATFAPMPQGGAVAEDEGVKIVKTCCRACSSNCAVLATVKNGRVVKLQGNPEDVSTKGHLCAKAMSGIQALYNPNRNKYPLIRVGERGENKWRRASWDEALDYIATKLMAVREEYGAEALCCSTGGGGNPENWSISRFCNAFGSPNWFEPGCAQCFLPRVLVYHMMRGGGAGAGSPEWLYPEGNPAKALVIWGQTPTYASPPNKGRVLCDLRLQGMKTVVIDPRLTSDAAKADLWLPIRPGTDVELMLAWIRYILHNELYDHEFVMKWTNLPYLVNTETKMLLRAETSNQPGQPDTFMVWDKKTESIQPLPYPWNDDLDPALSGTYVVDGVEYKTGFQLLWERVEPNTLEHAGEICWLEPDQIEKAIRIYAENTPSGLTLGVATDQTPNSVQAAMAACTLDMLMGNIEKRGTVLQRFKGSGVLDVSPGVESIVPPTTRLLPEEQLKKRLGGNEYKGLLLWWAASPAEIRNAMVTGKPYPVKAWIERSGNKLATVADVKSWLPAINNMDLIVHMYMYPTSFSTYADVLLPAQEWLETDMIVESCNKLFARQSTGKLWETMNETLFWSKLAKRCAELGHENCQRACDPEYMGKDLPYWDSMEEVLTAHTKRIGMDWEEFAAKTPIEFISEEDWRQYGVYQRTNPETGLPNGFNTPSKKAEVYLESLITLGRTGMPFSTYELEPAEQDYDPLPYYMELAESPVSGGVAEEFPLVMTNGRLPYVHHTTLMNVPWVREIYPVAEVWMNPADAKKYGIPDEHWVWIESPRGKIRARALVTESIRPGVVYMERFWNPETMHTETRGYTEMNVNMLTKCSAPYNDVVGTYTLRGIMVKIYPADSAPEGIWQRPEDFKAWLPQMTDMEEEIQG